MNVYSKARLLCGSFGVNQELTSGGEPFHLRRSFDSNK